MDCKELSLSISWPKFFRTLSVTLWLLYIRYFWYSFASSSLFQIHLPLLPSSLSNSIILLKKGWWVHPNISRSDLSFISYPLNSISILRTLFILLIDSWSSLHVLLEVVPLLEFYLYISNFFTNLQETSRSSHLSSFLTESPSRNPSVWAHTFQVKDYCYASALLIIVTNNFLVCLTEILWMICFFHLFWYDFCLHLSMVERNFRRNKEKLDTWKSVSGFLLKVNLN